MPPTFAELHIGGAEKPAGSQAYRGHAFGKASIHRNSSPDLGQLLMFGVVVRYVRVVKRILLTVGLLAP